MDDNRLGKIAKRTKHFPGHLDGLVKRWRESWMSERRTLDEIQAVVL